MIDDQGYRHNVGIILANAQNCLFFAKRIDKRDAWQFPQGGMRDYETPREAMFRELREELGLAPEDVEILAETPGWLTYDLPPAFRRYKSKPLCIGQKQKWFLLRLISEDSRIQLDEADDPEFSDWKWVDYWYPLKRVIKFKYAVYEQALKHFEPELFRIKTQKD